MKTNRNFKRKPINVPDRIRVDKNTGSALHLGIITTALVVSIFSIIFVTLNSALAFSIAEKNSNQIHLQSYAQVKKLEIRAWVPGADTDRKEIPNIEETAFKLMVPIKPAVRAFSALKNDRVQQLPKVKTVTTGTFQSELSNNKRYLMIGFLIVLFGLMLVLTRYMWRDFARNTSQKLQSF